MIVFNDCGDHRCKAGVSTRARPRLINGLGMWWRKFSPAGTHVNEQTRQRLMDIGRTGVDRLRHRVHGQRPFIGQLFHAVGRRHLDLIQRAGPVPQVLANGLHTMNPRWRALAVSGPALRLNRSECRLPLGLPP